MSKIKTIVRDKSSPIVVIAPDDMQHWPMIVSIAVLWPDGRASAVNVLAHDGKIVLQSPGQDPRLAASVPFAAHECRLMPEWAYQPLMDMVKEKS